MPRYKCTNKLCAAYDKTIVVDFSRTKFVNNKLVDTAAPCPDCGQDREHVKVFDGFTTFMQGSENICKK